MASHNRFAGRSLAIPPKPTLVYRFDPFEVDVAAGQLRKHNVKLRLAGQPLEILVMLLEHPGAVVTREEIQQRLWPAETFVDFENSLNKSINKLRQALSDSPSKPTFIETLPRKGYRFLVPVQRFETLPLPAPPATLSSVSPSLPAPAAPASVPSTVAPKSPRNPRSFLLVGAAIFFLLPALLFFRTQPVPRIVKTIPLTSSSRVDTFGHLFTDGARLFFLERHGDHWQLSQMPLTGGPTQPFPTPFPNAKVVAVSPDASELLLSPFTERTDTLDLWLMPSVGGTPRRLADIRATAAAFTPDGAQITFATDDGIFQIARDGLNLHTLLEAKGRKYALTWSPDGRELRFEWITSPGQSSRIWSVTSDGRNLHQLFPDSPELTAQCCAQFSSDGKFFFFEGFSATGARALYVRREPVSWFFRPTLSRLDTGSRALDSLLVGTDSRRLYALAWDARMEYVRIVPRTRESHSLLAGANAVFLNLDDTLDKAVYRSATYALWLSNPDGSERRELAASTLHPELPSFRPGGRDIAFVATPPGSTISKICIVSVDGGAVRDLVADSFSVYVPSWSRDGSQLIYAADPDDPAHAGLYLLNCNTKEKRRIPGSEGYWKARISPDGKWIASVFSDQKSVGLYDVAAQKWITIAHARVLSPVAWSPDSSSVFFQDLLEPDEPVHRYSLATRKTDVALDCKSFLEGGVMRCGFEDVLADGSLLLQLTRGDHDVYSFELSLP